jgi:hypothetical protein
MTNTNTVDLDCLFERLACIDRLIGRLKRIKDEPYKPTPSRKKAEEITQQISSLVQTLEEFGPTQFDIECEHDKEPDVEVGENGWSVRHDRWQASYQSIIGHLKDLEASAKRVVQSYPAPQQRISVPLAAMSLLHWRLFHSMPAPTFYDRGPAVQELFAVLELAGTPKDAATCRKALQGAYESFDPHYMPEQVRWIVLGTV